MAVFVQHDEYFDAGREHFNCLVNCSKRRARQGGYLSQMFYIARHTECCEMLNGMSERLTAVVMAIWFTGRKMIGGVPSVVRDKGPHQQTKMQYHSRIQEYDSAIA